MITANWSDDEKQILLTPNRSMSWRNNQLILLSMLFVSTIIAIRFFLLGAWVVIIFSVLELLLVGAAFYYVSWKLSYRELLTFKNDQLTIEKGVYRPRKKWQLDTKLLGFKLVPGRHKLDVGRIYILAKKDIALGEFLVEEDIQTLKSYLIRAGLKYVAQSASVSYKI